MIKKWLLFLGLCSLCACKVDIQQPEPGFNTLSGTVTYNGLGLADTTITLKTDGDDIVVLTDEKGSFSYSGLANGFYTIFPKKKGYLFTPSSYAVQLSEKNISGRDFEGSAAVGYRIDPWGLVWDASPRAPPGSHDLGTGKGYL